MDARKSIWPLIFGDGRVLLGFTGLCLIFSGAFALFLTANGSFLPHDAEEIGYSARTLAIEAPNLVLFMFHDRAAFGGVLLAIGVLYLWLAAFPLGQRQRWAWKTLLISGVLGFGSFLLYIGYGYLDEWHAVATLAMLPIFVIGLIRSRLGIDLQGSFQLVPSRNPIHTTLRHRRGAWLLFAYATGLMVGGLTICIVGLSTIFVPQDEAFIGMCSAEIAAISDRLLGVIAHDRAGFGGGLVTTGVTIWMILVNAERSQHLWDILLVSGFFGFACAIGVHFYVGYLDFVHLLPAYLGVAVFASGLVFARREWSQSWRD